KDKLVQRSFATMLALSLVVIILILVGLGIKSMPLLQAESLGRILTESVWSPLNGSFGFLPFIMGTIWVTLISLLISVPLCILASAYLVEYAGEALRRMVLPLVNVLAAIPPVLYGVWGVLFVVPFLSQYLAPIVGVETTGYTVFAGGIVLAVMIFPIMISIMVEVLQTIPYELKAAS